MNAAELIERRKALGLTQAQLAVALPAGLKSVWRWENGFYIPPYLDVTLEALERRSAAPQEAFVTTAVMERKEAIGTAWAVTYKLPDGTELDSHARKALPPETEYWKSEPDGVWSQWRRGPEGFSDIATGVTAS